MSGGVSAFIALIHPSDYSILLSQYAAGLTDIKKNQSCSDKNLCLTSHLRITHGDGHYVKLLVDLILLNFDEEKKPAKVFGNLKIYPKRYHFGSQETDLNYKMSNSGSDDNEVIQLNLQKPPSEKVSCRELQVLKLIAHGYSAKQIAHKLYISEHTAINHRKNLIEKFQVKNTAELIKNASKVYWL
ncbi:hypothetical protein HH304_14860 [Flammeovirgaceae bacterium KN852]|uniref:HTH luxR-type domain-containing protein n=2 Tax=Marinigracilibium pacificum TaxID=2729599 RepID=A0A848J1K1_9BACT|nr:hypothetical protein [Marinigracilibium pacificum]